MITKKTYIPGKPRSKKLTNVSGGGGIGRSDISGVVGNSHEHPNKQIIDQILQQHLDVLEVLSIVDGNLKIDANAYSTGELSAYGVGDGGGGGGSDYERLDTWADYDSSKSGWVLSALLGNDLNTRVTNLENNAGGGGGGSTVEWGTLTNGYRQLTVEGVTYALAQNTHKHLWADITDKPSTFTPSAHSHGWSEITGKPSTFTPSAHSHGWSEITGKPSTFTPSSHTHSAGDITSGTFSIARIPTGTTGTTVALGNHLHTGTYEPTFSKNTAFNKDFGTTSGTVAQGNDSRIINGQTAYGWGNHASAGYALNSSLSSYVAKTDSVYIGTTAVPLNRTSGTLDLSGIGTLTAAKVKVDLLSFDKSGNYVGIYDDGEGLPIIAGNTFVMSTYLNYGNVGIGTTSPSQKLHVVGNILATGTTTTTKVIFNSAGWSMEQTGTELQLKYNNVVAQRFLLDGSIVGLGEITAYGASTGGDGVALLRTGGTMTGNLTMSADIIMNSGKAIGVSNLPLKLLGNALTYNASNVLTEANTATQIKMGNGWTIEQTTSALTIKKNGVVKGTFNA